MTVIFVSFLIATARNEKKPNASVALQRQRQVREYNVPSNDPWGTVSWGSLQISSSFECHSGK